MNLDQTLRTQIQNAVTALFNQTIDAVQVQPTNHEFEGSHTLVCFPLTKLSRKGPEETGRLIGDYLVQHSGMVNRFNVVKGFLNLVLNDAVWVEVFQTIFANPNYGQLPPNGQEIMIEYSSPNTNKPLHLGHLRNNFLGYSVAEIYAANGFNVHKVQIINDRGIHICKSMAAWKLFGNGETPESTGVKGDHLVGKYYVKFDKELKVQVKPIIETIESGVVEGFSKTETDQLLACNKQIAVLQNKLQTEAVAVDRAAISALGAGVEESFALALAEKATWKDVLKNLSAEDTGDVPAKDIEQKLKKLQALLKNVISLEEKIAEQKAAIKEIAQNKTAIMGIAQDMLRKWEQKDEETVALWKTMNGWVYNGFSATYKRMGVDFEKLYYESDTYLLGKQEVLKGVEKGLFFQKEDGSVWVDLTAEGLDQKLLLRSDGTSVYMTQDIGTAILRFTDFPKIMGQVYTVGNEQEHHFKVLFIILSKLGFEWAKRCFHLSYGMVDLPTGKMKSREGTVVDADDLMQEMVDEAEVLTRKLGRIEDLSEDEAKQLFEMIGLGGLKFFLLKVDPKKRMLFDPNESIQLQGFTGPFIQYTHARCRSIGRKAESMNLVCTEADLRLVHTLEPEEREALVVLSLFETKIREAAREYSPAVIANYAFDLAKVYNKFYQNIPVFNEADQVKLKFRVAFTKAIADAIGKAMNLLGIAVPEKM
ncbi:arginine--tRNA ligase [Chryseolinea lacunae]|uniref:Arginine--tRNA ligase n=1 Tax=Chryseolinea lacunae TaxID=2801331 RepID=A0ABS1L359_9BACT|nr:arginine--tRNA ligase [Chryseolinea lacunae]MBL0745372.1 arginine--tRNA ligase [Chryseolinea lacunae]